MSISEGPTAAGDRELVLDGIGRRCVWPGTLGSYTEDDFWVDPGTGLAVVARGTGAIGGQGKPAGKLAVWSIAGEVGAGPAEASLSRGFARANEAIARLSHNWPRGLGTPFATAAALLLDGPTAVVAHLGDCRVSRLVPGGLEPLTPAHTFGAEHPTEEIPPEIARIPTRALGLGPVRSPEIQRIPVREGDVFLLEARKLEDTLSTAHVARELRETAGQDGDLDELANRLVRAVTARTQVHGIATFAIVRARAASALAPPAIHPASHGTSDPPRLRWLFAPGEPLADPPAKWAAGTPGRGPDPEWFAEVHGGVMGSDDPPARPR